MRIAKAIGFDVSAMLFHLLTFLVAATILDRLARLLVSITL